MVRQAHVLSLGRSIVPPVARLVALFLPFALLAVFAATALATAQPLPACEATDLTATFMEIPGSAGGGLVAYELTLRNKSKTACRLRFSEVRLLDKQGRRLPTTVSADPGSALGSTVVLKPGAAGVQPAYFSATFPGAGEPTKGPCEPLAYELQVVFARARARLAASVRPPTPVCSSGMLMFGPVGPGS